MMGWYHDGVGWGGWVVMALIMVAFWGLVVFAVVVLFRADSTPGEPSPDRRDPCSILDERFARGEIDEDEYQTRRGALRASRARTAVRPPRDLQELRLVRDHPSHPPSGCRRTRRSRRHRRPRRMQQPQLLVGPNADAVPRPRRPAAAVAVRWSPRRLTPRPATIDLGGLSVAHLGLRRHRARTAAARHGRRPAPGRRRQRAAAHDTSVHWHGIALRNDMDGVPGMTQDPIAAGESFTLRVHRPRPGHVLLPPALRRPARPRPVRRPRRRRPATSPAGTTRSGSSSSTTGSTAPARPRTQVARRTCSRAGGDGSMGDMDGMDAWHRHGRAWDGRHGGHAVPDPRRGRRHRLPALPGQRPAPAAPVTLAGEARPAGPDPVGQRRLRHGVPGRRSADTG